MKEKLIPGRLREGEPRVGRKTNAERQQIAVDAILDRHANGEPLVDICEELQISPATFRGWVRKDPDLKAKWREAEEEYSHSIFDQIASLSRKLVGLGASAETAQVNALKGAIEAYKHIAARLNPRQYADQGKTGNSGPVIVINTTLPIGEGQQPIEAIDTDFTVRLPAPKEKPE